MITMLATKPMQLAKYICTGATDADGEGVPWRWVGMGVGGRV